MDYQSAGRKGGQSTKGEAKGTAKLTEEDVREILSSAEPYKSLAQRFHVHPKHIHAIRRRQWWQHVEP